MPRRPRVGPLCLGAPGGCSSVCTCDAELSQGGGRSTVVRCTNGREFCAGADAQEVCSVEVAARAYGQSVAQLLRPRRLMWPCFDVDDAAGPKVRSWRPVADGCSMLDMLRPQFMDRL